ncbi:MAG: VTT domain-containing protein [Chloroflexi bacterium]|nr:VTT domain-containing protein [Chloroflexota bacterium]
MKTPSKIAPPKEQTERRPWLKEHYLKILALVFVIALSAVIFIYRDKAPELGIYGYLGVFVISLITSSSIVVPVPGWILIATLGAILNPFLVGVISGIGGTLGEITGYLFGYGGRIAIENISMYSRMVEWMKRWGSLTIFVLALIPNPLFDIAGAIAGLLRFPLWKFLLVGAAGRIPKHIFFAYSGAWVSHLLPP